MNQSTNAMPVAAIQTKKLTKVLFVFLVNEATVNEAIAPNKAPIAPPINAQTTTGKNTKIV